LAITSSWGRGAQAEGGWPKMAIDAGGAACLHVARSGTRSVVTRAFASSPLRLLMPRNHGHAAWVFTSTYGGGLVDGDALRIEAYVGPDATAFLGTQAATKVYRSPNGTSHSLDATVGAGGVLVVAPDPVVCFAQASYRQEQRFALADTANLILVDWLTSGRRASGERWQFDRYSSRLRIERGGRPIVLDALMLSPDEGRLASRMGRFETLCVVVVIGHQMVEHARTIVARVSSHGIDRRAELIVGASAVDDGCVVKLAATSVEEADGVIRRYLDFLPALLGDDPRARKW
jgi:urease accessory protein